MTTLTGRIAVVTGAGRGIGRRIAVRLARSGARVALVARTHAQLVEAAREIEALPGEAIVIPADVGSAASVAQIKAEVERRLGPPSILVNAAGIYGPIDLVWKGDPEAWIGAIRINTIAPYLLCRAFAEGMIASGWGRIISVSSAAVLRDPGPIISAYGTSKAALNHFTRHLAAEVAGTGVTANVIHPGDVKTEMWGNIRDGAGTLGAQAGRYSEWAEWVAQTGGDDPEKAADLVASLVSDRAGAINGRFLWIKDGLRPPIPSWGDFIPDEAWKS